MSKILVIEDNEKLAKFIDQFLSKKGYTANLALDGVQGLKAFAAGSHDLLLVDWKLPIMDGKALCEKVRSSNKGANIPIIMMSGFMKDAAEIAETSKELHLSAFLSKPFSFDLLDSSIKSALSEKAETPATPQVASTPPPSPAPTAPQTTASATLKGYLEKRPFEQVLALINTKKMSGTLSVSTENKKRQFYLLKGALVDLRASPEEDDFGNHLMTKGLISMVELGEYEKQNKEAGKDLRNLFVSMGCLSTEEFIKEDSEYLVNCVADCFSWQKGSFIFESKPSFIAAQHSAEALTPSIFYSGFKKSITPEKTSSFAKERGGLFLNKTLNFFNYQNHFTSIPDVYKIFPIIDGTKSCNDIVNTLGIDKDVAIALIYTLNALKMTSFSEAPVRGTITPPFPVRERKEATVAQQMEKPAALAEEFEDLGEELSILSDELEGIEDFEPEASAPPSEADSGTNALEDDLRAELERIKDKNYYEIFHLTRNTFSFNTLKKTYFELQGKYRPDKFFSSSGEIMSLDEELLSKLSDAYETLSNVASKENYDEQLDSKEEVSMGGGGDDDKMKIQVQFTSGKLSLEEGQYESAEKAFRNLVTMVPDKPEYLTYLALATYNNPANRKDPLTTSKVKEMINKSLQRGKLSMTYALKGAIFFDERSFSLAEAEFNKALKINPSNKTALKKMEEINKKKEEEKGGLFKRMFK